VVGDHSAVTVLCIWAVVSAIGILALDLILWLKHQRKMKAILQLLVSQTQGNGEANEQDKITR
jgi:hypothetical protein